MSKGIAVKFRQKFGKIRELKNQKVKIGGVAVLQQEGRWIYYLVTKKKFSDKPSMQTLASCLQTMRDHMAHNKVCKLAMPRVGCGLDLLLWDAVREIILSIFNDENVELLVRNKNTKAQGNLRQDGVPQPPTAQKEQRDRKRKQVSDVSVCKHNLFTHFPKDPNCEVCKACKSQRARCQSCP